MYIGGIYPYNSLSIMKTLAPLRDVTVAVAIEVALCVFFAKITSLYFDA